MNSLIDSAYQKEGLHGALRSAAAYLEDYSDSHFVAPSIIQTLYELLKNREKQLDWMLKMFEVKDPNLPYFAIRNSDPIQEDPIYKRIMKEIEIL